MTAPDEDTPPRAGLKPFLQHLEDLRRALVWSLLALCAGMAACCALAPALFRLLTLPLKGVVDNPGTFVRSLEVTGAMNAAMQVIFWGGLLLSAPVIIAAACWFIFPGLTRRERRAVLGGLGLAASLFAAGVAMGYFVALRPALQVMLWFNTWMGIGIEYFTVTSYAGFVLKLLLSFGLTFELPVVLLVLGRLGLVTSTQLREKRRHAIVIILILAAIITPTQDPFSQLMLAIPLILLYEGCIWMIRPCQDARPPVC